MLGQPFKMYTQILATRRVRGLLENIGLKIYHEHRNDLRFYHLARRAVMERSFV